MSEKMGVRRRIRQIIGRGGPEQWPWYVWPEGMNFILAGMQGLVFGPYASQREARAATKELRFERRASA